MKIENMNIKLSPDCNTTITTITNALPSGWTRDISAENNIKSMGSTQYGFNYNDNQDINASIFFTERNEQLETTNVVPKNKSELAIKECNNLIALFGKNVLDNINIKYDIV